MLENLLRRYGKDRPYYFLLLQDLPFRYLLSILNANEGSMIKTVTNNNLINILLIFESGASGPEPVMTTKIPTIPKTIDE